MLQALFCDKKKRWPRLGKNDSHYRNFRRPTLSGSPQTAYFCNIKNNKNDMSDQATIWILTVGCLLLIFLFRNIQQMRKETGHRKIFELEQDNNGIYDDYDEE